MLFFHLVLSTPVPDEEGWREEGCLVWPADRAGRRCAEIRDGSGRQTGQAGISFAKQEEKITDLDSKQFFSNPGAC